MDKRFFIVNLFMYEKNGDEEYSAILIAESKDQLKDLFYTAMSAVEKNHRLLEVCSLVLGNDLDINAVTSHVRNAIYEQKAIFNYKEIRISDTLPDLTDAYLEFEKGINADFADDEFLKSIIQSIS